MRGDINASELYQDPELLKRLGFGIYDVAFGSAGGVGFEDILKFSYVEAQEEDNKFYRRKVYKLTGNYYTNEMAKAIWEKSQEFQAEFSRKTGQQLFLKDAAALWLDRQGHEFFKEWTLQQQEVPFRMRNRAEPAMGKLEVLAARLMPRWRELLEAGFSIPAILCAELLETRVEQTTINSRYLRTVARLSGHAVKDKAELYKRLREVKQLQKNLCAQTGSSVSQSAATIEYFRRLTLVAEIESKQPETALCYAAV